MRNKFVCVTAAVFGIASSGVAFAADMAVKAPPPPPAPVYNWTGWYAGFNFGGGFGTSNNATTTTTPLADDLSQFFGSLPSGSTAGANSGVAGLNQSGPIGGVQIGYNFQLSPLFVFGFEADIQGAAITDRGENTGTSTESFARTSTISSASASCSTTGVGSCAGSSNGTSFFKAVNTANSAEVLAASFTNAAITASGSDLVTADLNWLGTVRLRAGYLVTPNLLLYATGGLAYGGVSASDSLTANYNLTADSFALAYSQAIGASAAAVAAATDPTAAAAAAAASTTNTATASSAASSGTVSTANSAANCTGSTSCASTNAFTAANAPIATGFGTNSRPTPTPAQSTISFAQSTTKLSAAITTTAQSFARVSDTKYGGTVGGGLEWMMAPNWSVKA